MNTLYSQEIREMVRSVHWGVGGFRLDIIEYGGEAPYLGLVIRPSNFNSFSVHDRIHIAEKVNMLAMEINQKGCPAYVEFWE